MSLTSIHTSNIHRQGTTRVCSFVWTDWELVAVQGKPNPRPIRVTADVAATNEEPIELMPEPELEFMSDMY